jgi:uncharacterized protein
MRFYISGHEHMMATHHSTLEFTKDAHLTKRGDCIIGVNANFSIDEIKNILEKETITITITLGNLKEVITAKTNKKFNHSHEIVIRKKDFISDRTLGIKADKAAIDLNRELIAKLKNPDNKALVEIK